MSSEYARQYSKRLQASRKRPGPPPPPKVKLRKPGRPLGHVERHHVIIEENTAMYWPVEYAVGVRSFPETETHRGEWRWSRRHVLPPPPPPPPHPRPPSGGGDIGFGFL